MEKDEDFGTLLRQMTEKEKNDFCSKSTTSQQPGTDQTGDFAGLTPRF